MNEKLVIKPNPNHFLNPARQTAPKLTEFESINKEHIDNVRYVMQAIADEIIAAGRDHDYTKIRDQYKGDYYVDLCNSIENGVDFSSTEWRRNHFQLERHHLNEHCPDDVNLVDIIESIVNTIVENCEINGTYGTVSVNNSMLLNALNNTIAKIKNYIKIKTEEDVVEKK